MLMRNLTVPFENSNANRFVQNGTEWNETDWSRLHYTTEQFWNGPNGYFWLVETAYKSPYVYLLQCLYMHALPFPIR